MGTHASGFMRMVNEAKGRIREVTVEEVKPRLDAGEKPLIVDVREESEWAAGHLPGAVHLGKGILERDIEKLVPDTGTELILYCGGGYRSALAAESLVRMGYSNVCSMDGGVRGWREAGGVMVQG